jgi:DNA-binding MarR family transcriptional regulator
MMDDRTLIRLRRVVRSLARELNSSATDEGLTPTQASVLGLISGRGPLGLGELAEIEGLNPTMLSRIVRALSDRDLIRRQANARDQRSVLVEVTSKGRAMHSRIQELRVRNVAESLDRLSTSAQRAILTALPDLEDLAAELRLVRSGQIGQD